MDTSRRPWVPLIAVALGYFMVILDATAVNRALPAISQLAAGLRDQRPGRAVRALADPPLSVEEHSGRAGPRPGPAG